MKRFKGLQDYAIYKKDGAPWTQEEYDIVTTAFEDPDPYPIEPEEAKLKYLFYNFNAIGGNYHLWFSQKYYTFSLTGFTVLEYNDFLKQLNPPIQRRKQL
jgi:hypothetical protein